MAEELKVPDVLPEDCVSMICSLTSPSDACRMSLASSGFRSATESDMVWNKFLPSDWEAILARAIVPLNFSSQKELFMKLCHSDILLDGGKQSFALEKSSGRKSFTLSARDLSILHSDQPNHWSWKSMPESRFSEVVELKTASRIEIEGKIRTQTLSPSTNYGAYLIMQTSDQSFGLGAIPSETSMVVGDNVTCNTAYLCPKSKMKQQMESLFYANRARMLKMRLEDDGAGGGEEWFPVERNDGWMEIEIGEFFTGGEIMDKEIGMRLMEIKGQQLKGGLIIEGIEVRPKD